MDIHKIYLLFQKRFRPKRMGSFVQLFTVDSSTRVLDVGGTLLNWSFVKVKPQLTILNIHPPAEPMPPNVKWVVGDARCMPFEDQSFDVVFSNSVIEHVGDWEDQRAFAREIRRVGKRYFVQTPNYYFPVEPHFITPFIHWLPRNIGRRVVGLTVRNLLTRDVQKSVELFDEVHLLRPRDMKKLFPDAEIIFERFLGLPKSILAIKK
ncbi:Methyltransferase type 11 [Rhodothermus marinus SG0.5JP17-172]|nr:Methyltransferase type 11 [Rhodothermus marinus SG0.5JP17-172]